LGLIVKSKSLLFGASITDADHQSLKNFLLGAFFTLCFCVGILASNAHAQQAGTLDTTFNGTGKVPQISFGTNAKIRASAIQPDGKILLGGECELGVGTVMCIARLMPNGSLDTSFASNSSVGSGRYRYGPRYPEGTPGDAVTAVALQSDGKIVIVGYCSGGSLTVVCNARLNTDGTPDLTYGGVFANAEGVAAASLHRSNDRISAIAMLPGNIVFAAGKCYLASVQKSAMCFLQISPRGIPTLVGTGKIDPGALSEEVNAIVLQPDGKIVLAGQCDNTLCAARVDQSGALDLSFAPSFIALSGVATAKNVIPTGAGAASATGVALQADGKIVLGGYCKNGSTRFKTCVARLDTNGDVDTTFAPFSVSPYFIRVLEISSLYDYVTSLVVQPDGKIIVGGDCEKNAPGDFQDFCMARLEAGGPPDPSFSSALFPVGARFDGLRTIALQPDGRIIAAGYCANGASGSETLDFCAIRVNPGASAARACSFDLDGDGQYTATIDGLIITRVMLGMRGVGVLNGISLQSGVPRNNWTKIRDYLNTQCGMNVS
jgi:uncharacterized delta-60 repeat protein